MTCSKCDWRTRGIDVIALIIFGINDQISVMKMNVNIKGVFINTLVNGGWTKGMGPRGWSKKFWLLVRGGSNILK